MLGRGLVFAALLGTVGAAPLVPGFDHAPDQARLLSSELSCTACHQSDEIRPKGGPVLDGVGARLQPEWIRGFLSNPQAYRPRTTMPDLFAGMPPDQRVEKIDALVHFLASQRKWKAPRLSKHSAPHTGLQLFNRIGCAACHADPIKGEAAAGLVSLHNLEAKYSFAALADLIHRPLDHRPSGRMPDLELGTQQAADIAAYLIDTLDIAENAGRPRLRPWQVDAGKAAMGAGLFRSMGCVNCHQLGDLKPELEAPPHAGNGSCRIAFYSLNHVQKTALAEAIKPLDAKGQIAQTMATFNCYACHARDGTGGPAAGRQGFFTGDETLGNEGKFPPHLTGVGAKLRKDWLGKVLAGHGRVRPSMHTWMPNFGAANTAQLAELFAKADEAQRERAFSLDGDVEAGRILLGTEGGVGCISCHGVGGRRGLAMHAITLDGAAERYHPGWFKRNLIDPISTRPGTLMPSFWPGGVAGNKNVLGGDTDAQIAAIWSYLQQEQAEPPPGYPTSDPGQFEIVPKDRPVVQRTMMEGVGAQTIAVGFPEGVHFAFDAKRCELAYVWRGRFIDGYKTWFSRKDPSAKPLGTDIKAIEPRPGQRVFRGYMLDESGIPTFLYREGGDDFAERIAPDGEGGFRVTIAQGVGESHKRISW